MPADPEAPSGPEWYRDGVFYECNVKAFADSNADGIGDFPGLTSRLDHLSDLGITAIWLLPFYPSPGRDDGYDIADYTSVHPAYGDLRSFKAFLRAAHRRGIKVITELVLNHTSDQHPWFQQARTAPPGSHLRDFYVWSDTPDRYREARVIFSDFETSNWAWDPVAGAYYWHRFYSHQPDLNYDHPPVREAVTRVLDFWLGMGVDGLRLDAVPYLFERDGTNCENLAETHAMLRDLRSHIDANYADRMLLAEANQWPEDAAAYFGKGDECHMNFHFPLMPRMFMAVQMESRVPVVDILEQTPTIPDGCQWATFLRNHDELTLEMVTEEERDFMYRAYARDPQMRINLGIRRRLAPLLDNDRRRIELLNAILFALPGTPVVYYGDELGLGDNVYLGDRDGVRTPMHWSPDRNAGFSTASAQRLYLPPIVEPGYHFESVNVEAQSTNPSSLLRWMRQLITLRRRLRVLGRGSLRFLDPDNHHVMAWVREHDSSVFMAVANLSRFAQQVDLDLSDMAGRVPVEVFGQTRFGPITEDPYRMSLGPYGYYWFAVEEPARGADEATEHEPATLQGRWAEVARQRPNALAVAFADHVRRQRWYGDRSRVVRQERLGDLIALGPADDPTVMVAIVDLEFRDGAVHTYQVPVALVARSPDGEPRTTARDLRHVVAHLDDGDLLDAAMAPDAASMLLSAWVSRRSRRRGRSALLRTGGDTALATVVDDVEAERIGPLDADQSNSSIVVGDQAIVKVIRRLDEGVNPELEIGGFLTGRTTAVAALLASWEIEQQAGRWDTGAIVSELIHNEGDCWTLALEELSRFFERVLSMVTIERPGEPVEELGPYVEQAALLGGRVAEVHLLLAAGTGDAAPEPLSLLHQRSLFQASRASLRETLRAVRRLDRPDLREVIDAVVASEDRLAGQLERICRHRVAAARIRVHGDLHLGQVLWTGHDHVLIDFEGEPARPITERRIRRVPLIDVAGLLRSYDYAAATGLRQLVERGAVSVDQLPVAAYWSQWWAEEVGRAMLGTYLGAVDGHDLVPTDADDVEVLLRNHLIDKALYEVRYEIDHRPEMVEVPLQALVRLAEPRPLP